MDPFAILSGIYSAVQSLRAAAAQVKANKKLARRLADRVEALLPELRALEQRQRVNVVNAGAGGRPQQPAAVVALGRQLQSMLLCLTDAVALVSSFGGASWMRRVISKGDYAEEFAAINSRLATAQADLGFGLQVDALIAAAEDADDAKADLEAIRQMLPILMTAVQQAEEAAERRHLSAAERQKQQIQLQQQQAKMLADMQAQMDAHLARAELRSRKAGQAARMADLDPTDAPVAPVVAPVAVTASPVPAPALSPSSPSSPSSRRHELLHIPLSDLQLEPRAVGRGGFGDVFRAQWTTRHMTVAVKKLRVDEMSAADIAEFDREAAILHALPFHAHVLQLHGVAVDEAAGTYLMIMEWMEGGSLHGLLKESRSDPASLPLSRRLQLCVECALGVNHLHQLQPPVVHRDIKSLNFLLDRHGQVKVGDFGLARMRSATATQSTAVQAAGTLSWLPPEFLNSDESGARATAASDVYSLGVVCWEILTGEEPFAGQSAGQIIFAIVVGKLLAIPPHLPAELTQLLHACWSMEPGKRPSCSDVIKALRLLQVESHAPDILAVAPSQVEPPAPIFEAAAPSPSPRSTSSSSSAVHIAAVSVASLTVSPTDSSASSISAALSPDSSSHASASSVLPDRSASVGSSSLSPQVLTTRRAHSASVGLSPPVATRVRAKTQVQLQPPSSAPARHALCLQHCARLGLRLWVDGYSERLVTELYGRIVPSSGTDELFPFEPLPSDMLLIGDQRLLTVDFVHGVRLFSFAIDAATNSITWSLHCEQKLAGAVGLAFDAYSSSVLTIGKGLVYGCNLFALDLKLEGRHFGCISNGFGLPIKVAGSGWVNRDCRIAVDNQRRLMAVSDPRDGSVAILRLSGSSAHDFQLSSSPMAKLDAPGVSACFDQNGAALLVTTAHRALIFSIHAADNDQWSFEPEPCAFATSADIVSSCFDGGVLTVAEQGCKKIFAFRDLSAPAFEIGAAERGLSSLQLAPANTIFAAAVCSVQCCARLQLRMWIKRTADMYSLVVEHQGRIQPAASLRSAYPDGPGKEAPRSLLLLAPLGLLVVTDSTYGVLLFDFHLIGGVSTVRWTLRSRQPLVDARGSALHVASSTVLVTANGYLHSLRLRVDSGRAELESSQSSRLVPHDHGLISVDNRRNLLAVAHRHIKQVRVYALTASGHPVSGDPLVELPFEGSSSAGVCFDSDGPVCTLAVSQHTDKRVDLFEIDPVPDSPATYTAQCVRQLGGFGKPQGLCIDSGELIVADCDKGHIRIFHSVLSAAAPALSPVPKEQHEVRPIGGAVQTPLPKEPAVTRPPAISRAELQPTSTTQTAGVRSVQSSADLRLRVWTNEKQGMAVEFRGRLQPASLLASAYPPGASAPQSLLLLAHARLLLVADAARGVLLFRFDVDEGAGAVFWTLCSRQQLDGARSLAFHCDAAGGSALVVAQGRLHSLRLCRDSDGASALEAPRELKLQPPVDGTSAIAVDSRRGLIAVAHREDQRVRVYALTGASALASLTPLVALPVLCELQSDLCFDPDGDACVLAVCDSRTAEVRLFELAVGAGADCSARCVQAFRAAQPTGVCIDDGELTVADRRSKIISVYKMKGGK